MHCDVLRIPYSVNHDRILAATHSVGGKDAPMFTLRFTFTFKFTHESQLTYRACVQTSVNKSTPRPVMNLDGCETGTWSALFNHCSARQRTDRKISAGQGRQAETDRSYKCHSYRVHTCLGRYNHAARTPSSASPIHHTMTHPLKVDEGPRGIQQNWTNSEGGDSRQAATSQRAFLLGWAWHLSFYGSIGRGTHLGHARRMGEGGR